MLSSIVCHGHSGSAKQFRDELRPSSAWYEGRELSVVAALRLTQSRWNRRTLREPRQHLPIGGSRDYRKLLTALG